MQFIPNRAPGQVIVYLLCFHSNDTYAQVIDKQCLTLNVSLDRIKEFSQVQHIHNASRRKVGA